MPSATEKYLNIIQSGGKHDASTVSTLFDQLPPIKPSHLLGSWGGGFIETGHPVGAQLVEIQWIGKEFRSLDDIDPVIIERGGKRVSWGEWGSATVKEILYRGVLSTTMVYDDRPIFDHFRYVNEDVVAGVMEGKAVQGGDFYFYLKR